jgi:LuxR family transcriptional regulator, quorum-sensing system regulator BjaR1
MKDAYSAAFELLQGIEKIHDKQSLVDRVTETLGLFGVTNFSAVKMGAGSGPQRIEVTTSNATNGWAERYLEKGYAKLDPFVPWAFQSTKAATWSELEPCLDDPAQKQLFGELQDYVPGDGFVVPIHAPNGPVRVVVMTGRNPDFSIKARPVLRLIAYYFYELLAEFEEAEVDWQPKYSPLTDRQTECLKWVSQGKSDWEIGQILGISQGTAHRHIERAKARLDVSTRMQAAMLAWRSGWMLA